MQGKSLSCGNGGQSVKLFATPLHQSESLVSGITNCRKTQKHLPVFEFDLLVKLLTHNKFLIVNIRFREGRKLRELGAAKLLTQNLGFLSSHGVLLYFPFVRPASCLKTEITHINTVSNTLLFGRILFVSHTEEKGGLSDGFCSEYDLK